MIKRIAMSRIQSMISAAQSRSEYSPATQRDWWLQDAWTTILDRIAVHTKSGRDCQAGAWKQAARFFAKRYDGQFAG